MITTPELMPLRTARHAGRAGVPERALRLLGTAALALALAACGGGERATAVAQDAPAARSAAPAPSNAPRAEPVRETRVRTAPVRGELGTVTAVRALESREPTTGLGGVIGGVVGAAVGSQIGGGDGRKVATAVGAVGGAVAGNEIEKRRNTHVTGYRVDVRLDDGRITQRTVAAATAYAVGQRVRVLGDSVVPA